MASRSNVSSLPPAGQQEFCCQPVAGDLLAGPRPSDPECHLAGIYDDVVGMGYRIRQVDVQSLALTHISQFIAPPLDRLADIASDVWPTGARQMTALLK